MSLRVGKQILPVPLSPDDRRSEVLAEVLQDEHIVALGVNLEDADIGQELDGVVGLEVGRQSH